MGMSGFLTTMGQIRLPGHGGAGMVRKTDYLRMERKNCCSHRAPASAADKHVDF